VARCSCPRLAPPSGTSPARAPPSGQQQAGQQAWVRGVGYGKITGRPANSPQPAAVCRTGPTSLPPPLHQRALLLLWQTLDPTGMPTRMPAGIARRSACSLTGRRSESRSTPRPPPQQAHPRRWRCCCRMTWQTPARLAVSGGGPGLGLVAGGRGDSVRCCMRHRRELVNSVHCRNI
jgi:hypothetical protein